MKNFLRRIFVCFCVFIFGCSSVNLYSASGPEKTFDNEFLKGEMLLKSGEIAEAVSIFTDLAERTGDAYIYLKVANIYRRSDDYAKAMEVLKRGVSNKNTSQKHRLYYEMSKISYEIFQDFENAEIYVKKALNEARKTEYLELLAEIYQDSNDFASAVSIYNELIKRQDEGKYFLQRGKLYLYLNLNVKAIDDFKRAVEIENNTEAALLLADIYIKRGEKEQAIRYLEIAQDSHPGLILPELKLAELYQNSGRLEEALDNYESVLAQVDGERKVYVLKQMGNIYLRLGEYNSAIDTLKKAYEINNDDTQSLFYIAVAYEALEDWDSAAKYYKRTLEVRSDYTEAKKRLAYVYLQKKEFNSALEILSTISEVYRDIDFYRLKAGVLEERGSIQEAIETVNDGLKENPNSTSLLINKAFLLEKAGDYEETVKILKRILENEPDNPAALNFLAYLYAENDVNLDEALNLVTRALNQDSENPAYLDTKAWILYKKGEFEKAMVLQKKALNHAPEDKELREHMEAILKALEIEKSVDEFIKN